MRVTSQVTRRTFALVLLAVLAAACSSTGKASNARVGSPVGDQPPGDVAPEALLNQPLGNLGVQVNSLSQAGLPFAAPQPTGLGSPSKLFAYAPQAQPDASMVAWVFNSSTFGNFVVLEYLSSWDEQAMAREASPVPSPGCTTTTVTDQAGQQQTLSDCEYNNFTTVSLPGGHTALLGNDGSTTTVLWAEPLVAASGEQNQLSGLNVVVNLQGPADGFSGQQATSAATTMTSNIG